MQADVCSDGAGRALVPQLLLIAAAWGTSFLFIKIAISAGLTPLVLATARAGLAGLAIAAWLILSGAGLRLPPVRTSIILGILNGLIPNILLASALSQIDSAPAALLQATTPLFAAIGGHFAFSDERLTRWQVIALPVALIGLALVIGPDEIMHGNATLRGAAATLGAALSYAGAALAVRRLRPPNPTDAALGQQIAAASMALIAALMFEPFAAWRQPANVWLAMVGLAIVSTAIPVIIYFNLLRQVGAARAALVHYLIPVAAVIYGAALLNERMTPQAIAGGLVVLGAVWIANHAAGRDRR